MSKEPDYFSEEFDSSNWNEPSEPVRESNIDKQEILTPTSPAIDGEVVGDISGGPGNKTVLVNESAKQEIDIASDRVAGGYRRYHILVPEKIADDLLIISRASRMSLSAFLVRIICQVIKKNRKVIDQYRDFESNLKLNV